MNMKHLKIIIALTLAATVNIINLNAADLAASPKVKASQLKTAPATTERMCGLTCRGET
jgi:hypothetical protein